MRSKRSGSLSSRNYCNTPLTFKAALPLQSFKRSSPLWHKHPSFVLGSTWPFSMKHSIHLRRRKLILQDWHPAIHKICSAATCLAGRERRLCSRCFAERLSKQQRRMKSWPGQRSSKQPEKLKKLPQRALQLPGWHLRLQVPYSSSAILSRIVFVICHALFLHWQGLLDL